MTPQAREWVAKAENDYEDAQRILRAQNRSDFSNACFHAQQCAEKYMKAVLVENGQAFRRIHDLTKLLKQLSTINPLWDALHDAAKALTVFAVQFRYPESGRADKPAATSALLACRVNRAQMREYLRLGAPRPKRRATPRRRRKTGR